LHGKGMFVKISGNHSVTPALQLKLCQRQIYVGWKKPIRTLHRAVYIGGILTKHCQAKKIPLKAGWFVKHSG